MLKNKGLMAMIALCVVAALCCAFYAGRLSIDRRADAFPPSAVPEPATEATEAPRPKLPLYTEDNLPYAYDPQRDEPSLPSEAAIESVVETQLSMARAANPDKYDEEKLSKYFREQIDIGAESYMPTIQSFPVEGSRSAVIVFPGGGYHMLSKTVEGTEIAKAFNARGITAFVVRYRIAPCDYRAILADGQRAVRYVRAHAGKYGVDPDRIAACGFSQGGHLALMTCQHPEFTVDDPSYRPDEVDALSSVPNACIVCYGVATLEKGHTFEVGAEIFTHGDEGMRAEYSAENGVTGDMCPTFVWLNADDLLVPVEGAYRLADALAAQGVPYAFHVFGEGGHGCGLGGDLPCGAWMSLACDWMDRVLQRPAD